MHLRPKVGEVLVQNPAQMVKNGHYSTYLGGSRVQVEFRVTSLEFRAQG